MTQMATTGGVEVTEIAMLVTGEAGVFIYQRCMSTATAIGRHVEECKKNHQITVMHATIITAQVLCAMCCDVVLITL